MSETTLCPACQGTKKQKITTQTWTSEGWVIKDQLVNCVWCNAKGSLELDRMSIYLHYANDWCKCQQPGEGVYYADGVHPNLFKHHWRCSVCGKILQIG